MRRLAIAGSPSSTSVYSVLLRARRTHGAVMASMAGPFSVWGKQYREGIDLFLSEHGDSVAGRKMDIIYRDVGGRDPARSKQLAQELVCGRGGYQRT